MPYLPPIHNFTLMPFTLNGIYWRAHSFIHHQYKLTYVYNFTGFPQSFFLSFWLLQFYFRIFCTCGIYFHFFRILCFLVPLFITFWLGYYRTLVYTGPHQYAVTLAMVLALYTCVNDFLEFLCSRLGFCKHTEGVPLPGRPGSHHYHHFQPSDLILKHNLHMPTIHCNTTKPLFT